MTLSTSRLNTLLRVRRIEEELTRARLGAAATAESVAVQGVSLARAEYDSRPESQPEGVAADFLRGRSRAEARAAALSHATARLAHASQETGVARDRWSDAAMRMTAIERLDERAREQARLEQLAADQRVSEETSAAVTSRGDR